MNFEKATTKGLEQLAKRIKEQLQSKGIDNTGDAGNSLEVQDNTLLGYEYIYFLDQGRAPGKFPPVSNIRDWVRTKLGIDEKKADSVAYLVGRKISQEGTKIWKDKSKGLELDVLINEMLEQIYEDVSEEMKVNIIKFDTIKSEHI
jgi:hypothetical protein